MHNIIIDQLGIVQRMLEQCTTIDNTIKSDCMRSVTSAVDNLQRANNGFYNVDYGKVTQPNNPSNYNGITSEFAQQSYQSSNTSYSNDPYQSSYSNNPYQSSNSSYPNDPYYNNQQPSYPSYSNDPYYNQQSSNSSYSNDPYQYNQQSSIDHYTVVDNINFMESVYREFKCEPGRYKFLRTIPTEWYDKSEIIVPEGIEIMDVSLSTLTNLRKITLPKSLRGVTQTVFNYCNSIESITFQEGILGLPCYLFRGCASLREIHMPITAVDYNRNALYGSSDSCKLYYHGPKNALISCALDDSKIICTES